MRAAISATGFGLEVHTEVAASQSAVVDITNNRQDREFKLHTSFCS